jgi:hypothetical protein
MSKFIKSDREQLVEAIQKRNLDRCRWLIPQVSIDPEMGKLLQTEEDVLQLRKYGFEVQRLRFDEVNDECKSILFGPEFVEQTLLEAVQKRDLEQVESILQTNCPNVKRVYTLEDGSTATLTQVLLALHLKEPQNKVDTDILKLLLQRRAPLPFHEKVNQLLETTNASSDPFFMAIQREYLFRSSIRPKAILVEPKFSIYSMWSALTRLRTYTDTLYDDIQEILRQTFIKLEDVDPNGTMSDTVLPTFLSFFDENSIKPMKNKDDEQVDMYKIKYNKKRLFVLLHKFKTNEVVKIFKRVLEHQSDLLGGFYAIYGPEEKDVEMLTVYTAW